MTAIHHISSDFDKISAPNLPPVQAQVVAALSQGQTITAAALEARIHRTTIHHWPHWLRTKPNFQAAVEAAQREYVAALQDEMRALSARALATLRSVLNDPAAPDSNTDALRHQNPERATTHNPPPTTRLSPPLDVSLFF